MNGAVGFSEATAAPTTTTTTTMTMMMNADDLRRAREVRQQLLDHGCRDAADISDAELLQLIVNDPEEFPEGLDAFNDTSSMSAAASLGAAEEEAVDSSVADQQPPPLPAATATVAANDHYGHNIPAAASKESQYKLPAAAAAAAAQSSEMSADTSSFVATMAEMERAEAAEQELLLRRFAGAGPVGGFLDDDEEEEELFGTAPRVTDMDGDGASHSSVSAFASAVADVAFSRHTVSASLLFEDNEESFGDQSAIEEPPDASPLRLPLRSVERVQARSKAFNGFDAPASSGVVAFDAPASAADGLDASARTNLSTTSAAEVLNASASFRRRRGGKTRGGARRVAPSAVGVDDKSPVPQEPLSVSAHSNDEAYTLSDHVSTPVPHPHALGVTSHVTPEERQVYQNQMHREPRQRLWGAKAVAAGNSVSPAMDKIVRVAGEGGTSQSGRSRIIQGRALRYATDDEDITKNDQVTWDDVGYVGSEEGDQSHAHRPLYHASPPSKNRSFLCAKVGNSDG